MIRIKIVSEGCGMSTKIINEETGEELTNVISVKWECNAPDELAFATLIIKDVKIDAIGMSEP